MIRRGPEQRVRTVWLGLRVVVPLIINYVILAFLNRNLIFKNHSLERPISMILWMEFPGIYIIKQSF